jgi:signal transduction histidine kinase
MRDEQILHDVNTIIDNSSRAGGAVPRRRSRFRWSSGLRWPQWMVLFTMGALVIAIEVRNHNLMWQDHNSGQTFWTDHMLVGEVIFFGLVLPILAGITLEYMGRTAIARDKMARELEFRRALVGQMYGAQSWHELVELLVTTPGTVVSADRAWLLAQRSDEEEFDQITQWERPGSGLLPSSPLVSPAVCERCEEATALKGNRILTCDCPDSGSSAFLCNRYCLWLSSKGMGKAALLFDMPFDHRLDPDQMKILSDLADQMSLAIDSQNLHDKEQRRGDVVRNERLRIARDIHDTLGQNVSYLRLKLEQLSAARLASDRTEFQDELASMLAVADEAYEQMRDTLEELRTTEHLDLEEALRLYASQAAARAGFSLHVHSSGQAGTLSPRQRRQMMYIAREALNNVEKHAGAENVDIHLQWCDSEFRLIARDDGKGFQPQALNRADGYGMAIMGERSQAINANLAIDSTPDAGTELTLSLPLSSSAPTMSRSQ